MADHIHVRGEGGMIIQMDLPLPDHIEHRLNAGHIRRCNEDGSPWRPEDEGDVGAPPTKVPSIGASKAKWAAWAVAQGATPDEAEGATKQDLIDAYGGGE